MADTNALKSMLNNFINDKPEEATLDLHGYLTTKMKDVAGISVADEPLVDDDTVPEVDPEATQEATE